MRGVSYSLAGLAGNQHVSFGEWVIEDIMTPLLSTTDLSTLDL